MKLKAIFKVLFNSIFIFGEKCHFHLKEKKKFFLPKPGLVPHSIPKTPLQDPSFRPLARSSKKSQVDLILKFTIICMNPP